MVEMPKEFVPEADAMDEPETFTGNRALCDRGAADFRNRLARNFRRGLRRPPHPSPLPKGRGDAGIVPRAVDEFAAAPSPLGERVRVRGDFAANRLGGLERSEPIGLPGLSEPEAIRHYVRLSQKNYSIDTGIFPLGSCTMKHNPRLNEKMARLPGFARHPSAAAGENGAGRAGPHGGAEPLAA